MWSFGVSLYQMAVAYFPTSINKYRYNQGQIPFRKCDWNNFDFPKIKNIIESCLQLDSSKRITAQEAINHEWFET
jgi:serine/threonine protein kinase